MNKKKVCMIIPSFTAKGGIAAVASGYRDSRLEQDFDIKYIQTYCDGNKIKKLFMAIKSYCVFLVYLLFWKPNLIHIHSSFGPSFYRSLPFINLSYWSKIPIINHIHGSEFDKFYTNAGERKQKQVQKAWEKCSEFIVLSSQWKERFSIVIPESKMEIVQNYSIPHGINMNPEKYTILFLGAINKMKGCYDAVEVVAKIKDKIPNVKLVMAGSGEIENIKQESKEFGVENNIIFPGWVRDEEKDKILKTSTVFFLPSYTEGMPMSILDAMGYGLPVVTTNIGGIPKLVTNNENGYMCEPGDIEDFSHSLLKILSNDKLRTEMGKKSLEIIENNYSINDHIDKIIKLYKRFLY